MSQPNKLLEIIQNRIAQQGPMDIGEYMALCLGHPQYGYYMTRDPFGKNGDFITAPEISQLFGEMIGVWLADLWIKFGSPSEFILLEVGPGKGVLMADIMRATKHVAGFHEAAKIHLMEMSPALRNAQGRVLANYETQWIDDLNALNSAVPVFIIGNEFLDALPIRQLELKNGKWWERMVGIGEDNSLRVGLEETVFSVLESQSKRLLNVKDEGIYEVSPAINAFVKSIDNLLIKQTGAGLFLDYGYTKSGMGDTLQAVKAHRFESPFENPCEHDITAHVDFENIKNIAKTDGVAVHGPVTQRDFLRALGIEYRAKKLIEGLSPNASSVCGIHEPQIETIQQGLNRLIDTEQMGILFKVIALCHDPKIIPAGFDEGL